MTQHEKALFPRLEALARAKGTRDALLIAGDRPAPTVIEDLQAVRRRPWDAPMATRERREPQPPAGYRPPVTRINASRAMTAAIASLTIAGCVVIAIAIAVWLGVR